MSPFHKIVRGNSTTTASQRLCFIILLKRAGIEPHHLVKTYTTIIRSVVEYSCQVWDASLTTRQINQLESVQKTVMGIIFCGMGYDDAIATTRIPTLADRRETPCRSLFARMQQTNHRLHHLSPHPGTCNYSFRNPRACGVPRRSMTNRSKNSFVPYGLHNWHWNNILISTTS